MATPNPNPFEKHASIELKAEKMLEHCAIEPAILLDTAYRKAIMTVPDPVINSALARWTAIIQRAEMTFDDVVQAWAVYRRVANSLWDRLTPVESREYLIKAKNKCLT